MSIRTAIIIPAVLLILLSVPAERGTKAASSPDTIRVAVLKNAESFSIFGSLMQVVSNSGTTLSLELPATIRCSRGMVSTDGRSFKSIRFSSPADVILNGRPYRGIIEATCGDKGLLAVNELSIEDYLVGLINSEISSTWPIESVKAQAVVARTYAVTRKQERKNAFYHLESTVHDQVYNGSASEDTRAARAVQETAGEILVSGSSAVQAFYHSNCGGRTESSENVWGLKIPYLQGVDCQYCITTPSGSWDMSMPLTRAETLLRSAGHKISGLVDVRPGARNSRGRLKNVVLSSSRGETSVKAVDFRKALGYSVVKSTNFEVRAEKGELFFKGLGYGHGVGLCQWGSKQRALEGFSYREILSYYYPGTSISKISDN